MDENSVVCAPGIIKKQGNCIKTEILEEYINSYNKYSNNNINLNINFNSDDEKRKYLLNELYKIIPNCHNKKCLLNNNFVEYMDKDMYNKLKNDTFRPTGPSNNKEWLSNININEILFQYENVYDDFKFLGTVPIDFDYIDDYYYSYSNCINIKHLFFLDKLYNAKKYKLGLVINLDELKNGGTHWVSLYIDMLKKYIYFFDSVGSKPNDTIVDFIVRCVEYCNKNLNIENFDVQYNKNVHQKKGSECGIYAVNFILRLLRGDVLNKITNNITSDDKIYKCRKVYFNKN